MEPRVLADDTLKVLSLFAGCGGMDLGFEQAGFAVAAANEFWHPAAETYRRNFPGTVLVEGDINDPSVKGDLVAACGGSCDVLIGGPPCQAYSMAGRRDPNDPRGRLFEAYVEMVGRVRPMFTVMENVKGLLSMRHDGVRVRDLIHARIDEAGYQVFTKVLDAADYGVPQHRERVIILGARKDVAFDPPGMSPFPPHTHSRQMDMFEPLAPHVSVRTAIADIADLPEDPGSNHVFTKHSPEYVKRIHMTPWGSSVTRYSEACFRCHPDFPSKTVKANNGGVFIHYDKDRCMSARELARLQGFPDQHVFHGTKGDVLKQIGNAVPPPLAKAIAEKLRNLTQGLALKV